MAEVTSRFLVPPNVLPDRLAERVGKATVAAYRAFAGDDFWHAKTSLLIRNRPDDYVWRLGACSDLSHDMADALEPDYAVKLEDREAWPGKTGAGYNRHVYPVIISNGIEFVADPSWQQFFAWQREFDGSDIQPPDAAPLVLAGTRESVVAQARGYGLTDPRILNLWGPEVK